MDNEQKNPQPEAEMSAVTNQTEEEEVVTPEPAALERSTSKFGPFVVMTIAVVCLLVVFAAIFLVWMKPEPALAPVAPTDNEPAEPVEPTEAEVPEVEVDPAYLPTRDPAVLGLRIDTSLGRFFTEPETGQTLYVSDEVCVDTCLDDWTPYVAAEAVVAPGSLRTTERPDGTLQYTWNGRALYTYNLDDDRSVLGDGYNGTWQIARP